VRQIAAVNHTPKDPKQAPWLIESQPKDVVPITSLPTTLDNKPTPLIPVRNASLQSSHKENRFNDSMTTSCSHQKARPESSRYASYVATSVSKQSYEGPLAMRSTRGAEMNNSAPTQSREAEYTGGEVDACGTKGRRTFSDRSDNSVLWKRRSLGAETLRGLLPLMTGLSATTRNQGTERGPSREAEESRPLSSTRNRGKKDANRWGWVTWF
jgi:hypothetical protein